MTFTASTILETTDLPEKTRREIPRIINRLLGQTFLYQDDESGKEDYYLVHRHRAVVAELLNVAGFTLLHDDYHRIFQAISGYGYCRQRFKLDESLMIVVLRKLYEIAPSPAKNAIWVSANTKPLCATCAAWG